MNHLTHTGPNAGQTLCGDPRSPVCWHASYAPLHIQERRAEVCPACLSTWLAYAYTGEELPDWNLDKAEAIRLHDAIPLVSNDHESDDFAELIEKLNTIIAGKVNAMNYTLHLPPNYTPPPLPGRDEWIADLRANPDKQGMGRLGTPNGPNCCLGRLSLLQGRLTPSGFDGTNNGYSEPAHQSLCVENPMRKIFGWNGVFPKRVSVSIDTEGDDKPECLSACNDAGLSFAQIADIIETVWSDGGPLLK